MSTNTTKTVVVTGATGFVGRQLTLELLKRGYDVRVLTRNIQKAKSILPLPISYYSSLTPELFQDAHAVVHLAGEPIAERRWSAGVKEEILNSRTHATSHLVETIKKAQNPPAILVGTSAIGLYGDRGDEVLTEDSLIGEGFLSDVCRKWEASYSGFNGRLAVLRVGVVLGHGGALNKMLPPFRFGGGGKLASGKQWMSWIHVKDLVNMYLFAIVNENVSGPFNAVSPDPVRNTEFTRELSRALKMPAVFPVPALALKILFGEMSTVLLSSQNVSSQKIRTKGFNFQFGNLSEAFKDLLCPLGFTAAYIHEEVKWLPKSVNEVFPFFSEAKNLETITPPWLNFHIVKSSTPEITEGTLIDYKLRIKGLPAKWKTLISTWRPGERFVDEQLKGPYKTWHHTHDFVPMKGGTLLYDRVVYRMPFGLLGDVVKLLMVEKDIRSIFRYRTEVIDRTFPGN